MSKAPIVHNYPTPPRGPYSSREFLVACFAILAGCVLMYQGETDKGIELVKWSMVAYLGSRTVTKGVEQFKSKS